MSDPIPEETEGTSLDQRIEALLDAATKLLISHSIEKPEEETEIKAVISLDGDTAATANVKVSLFGISLSIKAATPETVRDYHEFHGDRGGVFSGSVRGAVGRKGG